jgi:hypothetical protein
MPACSGAFNLRPLHVNRLACFGGFTIGVNVYPYKAAIDRTVHPPNLSPKPQGAMLGERR